MYLKSIEVYGFKSFANKIDFEFHNGVTAIVGPNGSGKSNVADAVRWVLGEQRVKQLRGSNMQDIIFAGTELRKPMSYASVDITMDNSDHALPVDYNEVKVSRRLYRSGESEYLINGTSCRLKDIQEMFYDTGIGKEGYSIIGQGQIDRILSGKHEERRELFDEAAGIVKYKRRKAAAQKKLEEEHINLSRVSDILVEIEKHLSPLEKQAEIAKIYLSKRDTLKIYDVNLFLVEINRIKNSLDQSKEKYQITLAQLDKAKIEFEEAKEKYLSVQDEINSNDDKAEQLQQLYNENNIKKEKYEGELNLVNEQINSAKNNDDKFIDRVNTIEEKINKIIEERDKYLNEKKELLKQDEFLMLDQQTFLDDLHKEQGLIEEINNEINGINNSIKSLMNEDALEKANQERFDTMNENIIEQKNNAKVAMADYEAQRKELTAYQNDLKKQYADIVDTKLEHDSKQSRINEDIENIKIELNSKNTELIDIQNKYYREVSKLESLNNISDYYEGYQNSVKKIMEKKGSVKGIIGVAADIIQTERKYETAIEIALGGNIQNIITEDEDTAEIMIEFLKENKHGRATFLPLTSVSSKGFEYPEALKSKGAIGLADSLVKYDSRYSNIVKFLLGSIMVVNDVNSARLIAQKYKHRIKIVTLDGEFLAPGGSITGGNFKHNNNFLGRKREIEDCRKNVSNIKKQLESATEEISVIKNKRDELRNEYNLIITEKQNISLKENTVNINLRKNNEQLNGLDEYIKAQEILINKLDENYVNISNSIISTQNKLLSFKEHKLKLEDKLEKDNLQLEESRKKESSILNKLADMQTERQTIIQKAEFSEENINRLTSDLDFINKEKETLDQEMKTISSSIKSREEYMISLKNMIAQCNKDCEAYENALFKLKEEKANLSKSNSGLFQFREELTQRISALDKESYRLSSQLERQEENRNSFISYMWEEYQITYDMAKTMYRDDIKDSELKRTIKELKNDIKALGNVNVNSIEEYKETLERYDFLKKQHDDITKAEETLKSIIKELDVGMRKQFKESFEKISLEFNKTFKELFEGGKGTLELLDAESGDILDAGIAIIAQPPGKKLQNMMQLSGGEKSLTAIALLFAIQNLKPSPFCLLDEIEAALDDSNVVRFSKYLGKLTKHTQFIVITHRKGTMAAADRLYGITMQEKGISTLVSVNLIEEQLEA